MIRMDIMDALINTPSGDKWGRIGSRRRAGVVVPLFSVYSANSVGIGDFNDIKLLVDWCHKTGNSILQLLPMNEVGATFCPYDALSSFALEPAYIALEKVDVSKKNVFQAKIDALRKKFPSGENNVDYRIKEEKMRLLWEMYRKLANGISKEFENFQKVNSYWIDDFAVYKVLKDENEDKPWYEWEDPFKTRDVRELNAFKKTHSDRIIFQKWVQWVAFEQFGQAKKYAGGKKVLIKGDLPILISRDSADVWAHPDFFKLDFAAGAPPDMYCAKGQRWGMPTYEWDMIAGDGYHYFKEKLKFAENFYDIIRVDHVVGLFRIWSIPENESPENVGLNGFFDPSDEGKWESHGKEILSLMLESTDMLLCAEDLGIIPAACPKTLREFGIPGNDVQRWVKDWNVKHDFLEGRDYRFLSVTMLSTHDTTTWPAWWENEAGTIDEALFIRKCDERGIDQKAVRRKLFDPLLSKHGRLRWLKNVSSADMLAGILGRRRDEVMDFVDMYENTYMEKEKLWKHLNMKPPMREKSDPDIIRAVLDLTLKSNAIFCIQLLMDYLYLADVFKGDPYKYRLNKPGTVSDKNWSLVMPVSLEKLLSHKMCGQIKQMITSSDR